MTEQETYRFARLTQGALFAAWLFLVGALLVLAFSWQNSTPAPISSEAQQSTSPQAHS